MDERAREREGAIRSRIEEIYRELSSTARTDFERRSRLLSERAALVAELRSFDADDATLERWAERASSSEEERASPHIPSPSEMGSGFS